MKRLFRTASVLVAAVAALVAGSVAAQAEATGADRFAAQGRAAGLTADQSAWLRAEVDHTIAVLGGKQVGLNKVDVDGAAQVSIALPGEAHPRDFAATRGAAAVVAACSPRAAYGYFCAYSDTNLQGSQIAMYSCRQYEIPWVSVGSWHNNQTRGTVAKFMVPEGPVVQTSVAPSDDWLYDWQPIKWVRNC
ncbi:hypothetical protein [Actinokineospora sp. NBRC 105648]|uniref:hypothetical protein n=1 Tax=Actinokineospora sp. NBRC 105648 TaxID=3032206 RepID=UPI0024A08A62|nr:hypothetical protein [Actinokineospora sp. NBRC 105648]GLZ37974.1 hypothetical protein Acsp05_15980 [Actinokineospora sp. NBRC 105648]